MFVPYSPSTEEAMRRLFDSLGERERRLYAAAEALKLGAAACSTWARLFGCDPENHSPRPPRTVTAATFAPPRADPEKKGWPKTPA